MKRRTFLVGAAALMIADQALAEPGDKPEAQMDAGVGKAPSQLIEVTVAGVYGHAEPELSDSTVVVLQSRNAERYAAVWIGMAEGISISQHLHREKAPPLSPGQKPPRPLSQDFMAALVKALEGDIESVVISFEDDIYYAVTTVSGHGKTTKVDSRPSDAIGLALRFDAPLFVAADVLKTGSLEKIKAEIRADAAELAKGLKERAAQRAKEAKERAKPQ